MISVGSSLDASQLTIYCTFFVVDDVILRSEERREYHEVQ